jgi:hypothetical protein
MHMISIYKYKPINIILRGPWGSQSAHRFGHESQKTTRGLEAIFCIHDNTKHGRIPFVLAQKQVPEICLIATAEITNPPLLLTPPWAERNGLPF